MKVEMWEHPTEEDWMKAKVRQNSNKYMMNRRFGKLVVIRRGEERVFPSGRHRDTWSCQKLEYINVGLI